MILRSQDILVLLKLVSWAGKDWTYAQLAKSLSMGVGEVHRGLGRALRCRLVDGEKKRPLYPVLLEFLVHGLKHCCPAERGPQTRGVPTGHAAPFVRSIFTQGREPPPVWPHPEGKVRGSSLMPLYRSVPDAALEDEGLYRLLVLVDLIRGGNAREREWAEKELAKTLEAAE